MIPPRFSDRVIRHFVAASVRDAHPLVLAVQGEPGSGKSFQIRTSLEAAGVEAVHTAAVDLSGGYEGDSMVALREAVQNSTQQPHPVAIVVNDLDLSPAGQHQSASYTVNSQLLSGALMDLCDLPETVRRQDGFRVPIFVTGNNLTLLPRPVTRPSRMDLFTWEPSGEETASIVTAMFEKDGIEINDSKSFLQYTTNQSWSIASFAALLSDIIADELYVNYVASRPRSLHKVRQSLNSSRRRRISVQTIDSLLRARQNAKDHTQRVTQ